MDWLDDKPCVIVLCDMRRFAVKDLLFIQNIQTILLGVAEYARSQEGEWVEVHRHPGMFTSRKKYVSAVAVVFAATGKTMILHNPNASISLLGSDLLSGFPSQYQAVEKSDGLRWQKV
ncbi:hypothetical protein [Marinobacter orientalis]|uniref:Uncharacterized protein n=1 Tax=Marinobacter orientalis TaxID=1928859 RepID=A0A7Y0WTL8_9GAMM|nr:hypothetical protein [Marinobacter orientalis]NMT65034.1 hypothetical protein [Marinobacter orientalis]TGX49017.1 hypothetical protein DIT72_13485 [Marinobacter orientalis]